MVPWSFTTDIIEDAFLYGQPVTVKINYAKKKSFLGDHAPKSLMNVKYSYRKKQSKTKAN